MAGASMIGIKSRLKSVKSTMQITKAMELVATSKLRRAKANVERCRPFHKILREAINGIENSGEIREMVWSAPTAGEKTLFIVIAGDRGLAGGYNSNVFRLVKSLSESTEPSLLTVGKKAQEHYSARGAEIYDSLPYADDVTVDDCLMLAEKICLDFKAKRFDRVVAVYTKFTSMISQITKVETILPLEKECESECTDSFSPDPIYGGEPEEILEKIVPSYVSGILHSAVLEALASESGARRMAMNSANKNAEEMISDLMLKYNRARQAVITQEITEIVSGAEAL